MRAVNGKILVRVDMAQKNSMRIGDMVVRTMPLFNKNYRERSPVVAQVAESNRFLTEGDIIVTHHNHFYEPSPYHLQDDLFSIPLNKTIFGVVSSWGELRPLFGNIICNKIEKPSFLPLPPEQRELFINKYEVVDAGWTTCKKGQMIFTRPNSGYEIVYNFNGEERRVIKVDGDMVCGVLKP